MNREDKNLEKLEYDMYLDLYKEEFKIRDYPGLKAEVKRISDKVLRITILKKERRFLFWTNWRPLKLDIYFYYQNIDKRSRAKWHKDAIQNTNRQLTEMFCYNGKPGKLIFSIKGFKELTEVPKSNDFTTIPYNPFYTECKKDYTDYSYRL